MTNPIVDRIVALFNLADPNQNQNEHERAAAMVKARALMEEHDVSVDHVDAIRSGTFDREWVSEPAAKKYMSKVTRSEKLLAMAVAKLLGLRPVGERSRSKGAAVLFCGDRATVAVAQALYAILRETMNRQANGLMTTTRRRTKYKHGWATGVMVQVFKMEPSSHVESKAEWANAEAVKRLDLVTRKTNLSGGRGRAYVAGLVRGLRQDIGHDNRVGGVNAAPLLPGAHK